MPFLFKEVPGEWSRAVDNDDGRGFKRTKLLVVKFLNEVLADDRPVDVEADGSVRIKCDRESNLIDFEGFGARLLARPQYVYEGDQWLAKVVFHRVSQPLAGDAEATPVYEFQIDKRGDLTCGQNAKPYNLLDADYNDMWHIRKRVLLDLLAVVQFGEPPGAE